MDASTPQDPLTRIRTEFCDMPGLKLTLEQVGRLCGLTRDACEVALAGLTRSGFLKKAQDGSFLRPSSGSPGQRALGA